MQTPTVSSLKHPIHHPPPGPKQQVAQAMKFVPALTEREAREAERLFKALGDHTRLQILSLLHNHAGEISVFEIVETFPLEQPTISYHLRILRDAKLVQCRKHGVFCYYFIHPDAWGSCICPAFALLSGLFCSAESHSGESSSHTWIQESQLNETGVARDDRHPDRA